MKKSLCIKRRIPRLWVNCWHRLGNYRTKWINSLSDARVFYDPDSGSSSGAAHVPDQPPTIVCSRTLPRCGSGLPRDTQHCMGTSGNVFERPPAQEGLSSTMFNNSNNLASSSQELRRDTSGTTRRRESEMKRESLSTSIHPTSKVEVGMLNHTGGTLSHSGMIDNPRFQISELHLGKFPNPMEFQSWKVNFKTEVCTRTADPQITMHWIKEVIWDCKVNWRTCYIAIDYGARRFPWLRYFWCDDCVCIEKSFSTRRYTSEKE